MNPYGGRFTIITQPQMLSPWKWKGWEITCPCSPLESSHVDQRTFKSLPLCFFWSTPSKVQKKLGSLLQQGYSLFSTQQEQGSTHMKGLLLSHVECSDNPGMSVLQWISPQSELQISGLRQCLNSHSHPRNTMKTFLKKTQPPPNKHKKEINAA